MNVRGDKGPEVQWRVARLRSLMREPPRSFALVMQVDFNVRMVSYSALWG